MSHPDDNLFGSVALLTQCVRHDRLQECLRLQRSESPHRSLGEILLERGYITKEQLQTVLEARRKRGKKQLAAPEDMASADRAFGQLAMSRGFVTVDDLESAVLEQHRLRGLNLRFGLGEIFVAKSKMKPSDVLEILSQQGKMVLLCPLCELHYNVVRFQKGKLYACPHCGAALLQPKFLETVAVDGVIQG